MILCVGLSPALGRVISVPALTPGAVNRASGYLEVAAGKATNAARVIVQSGGQARVVTPLGARSAEHFRRLASEDNVSVAAVEYVGLVRWAITLVDLVHGATEIVCNEPDPVPEDVGGRTVDLVKELIADASTVLIAGSRLDNIPPETITGIVEAALAANVPLFLDIRGDDLVTALSAIQRRRSPARSVLPVTIKINEEEFRATADHGARDASDMEELALQVSEFARAHRVSIVVTRGAEPVVYADPGGTAGAADVPAVSVVNPIGSGDTFLGTLSLRMEAGDTLRDAVIAATTAASRNAQFLRPGTIEAP
jgi:fructose-1-phosphate kinase PfkB-like protein